MERSRKILFVSHCIFNQNAKAVGKEKASGSVRELVDILAESDVGVVQLACPQITFNGGSGIDRTPSTKETYDNKAFRSHCRKIAKETLDQIEKYLRANYNVLGILGVEFSPTCAVYQLEKGGKKIGPGKGIFTEELENEMKKRNFQVPIVGANLNSLFATIEKVRALLRYA